MSLFYDYFSNYRNFFSALALIEIHSKITTLNTKEKFKAFFAEIQKSSIFSKILFEEKSGKTLTINKKSKRIKYLNSTFLIFSIKNLCYYYFDEKNNYLLFFQFFKVDNNSEDCRIK